jgi:hypothetical protein
MCALAQTFSSLGFFRKISRALDNTSAAAMVPAGMRLAIPGLGFIQQL